MMWKKYKICDIATVLSGATPATSDLANYDGEIVWITPKDLALNNSKYISRGERNLTEKGYKGCSTQLIPPYNILMSSRAPIGLLAINRTECCTNQGFKNLVIDKSICDVDFFYYYLKYHIEEVQALGSGTTFKEVSKSSLQSFVVSLPSLDEQKQIANILSTLDEKIALNRQINDNLEAMAKQLYDYWFVQFDFPNEEGKPYKSSGGAMVWNEKLKREIPENWKVDALNKWLEIKSGFPFKSETYLTSGHYKVITIKNVQDGELVTSGCDFVDEIPSRAKDYISLQIGDRLISLTGNCGRLCVVFENNLLLNQRVGLLYCDELYLEYLYNYLNSRPMRIVVDNLANGAAQANLSPVELCNTMCVMPQESTLREYNGKANVIRLAMIQNNQEIATLTKQRDELLPLLMNGQVSVNYHLQNL